MSLRVWLPLTKDLRQQGLSNMTATNNGATYSSTGGKLGGTYTFNGSSNYLTVPKGYFGANYSYSLWFYTTSTSATQNLGCCRNSIGEGFAIFLIGGRIRIDGGGAGDVLQWNTNYYFTANTWTHLTVTCANGVLKFYINGVYQDTKTITLNSSKWGTIYSIGASQASGSSYGNYLSGKINDIRIYDHVLSQMEVKELAKGLVLHYPLNRQGWGQENLLKNSNFLQGTNGMQGYTATSATCTKQTDCMKVVSTSASGGFYSSNFDNITTGDMTTFSADVKADSNMTIYIGADGSGNGSCQAYTVGTSWQRIHISKAKTTSNPNLRIYGNGTFYAKNLKYELGSIATSWCPNSSDALATTLELNGTTEYDCSGFCNNGIKVGTLTYSSDTAKYAVSTHFNGSSAIKNTTFPFSSAQWSIAFWYKFTTTPSAYQGFICLSRNAGADADKKFAAMPNTSYIWFKFESTSFSLQSLKTNEWCHIVATCDGTNGKIYENGVLKNTTGSVGTILTDCDDFVVGARANSANAATTSVYLNGNMSDVRIYATALSADDVKSLYQNSAYIDSSGNVYGAVHSEV